MYRESQTSKTLTLVAAWVTAIFFLNPISGVARRQSKGKTMKNIVKITLVAAVLAVSSFVTVSSIQAQDDTLSVDVSMTFTEPFNYKDCPFVITDPATAEGFCGSGQVIPLGHATETIEFFAGSGGTSDLRTINLAEGSIFSEEVFSFIGCHGVCEVHQGNAPPFSGTLAGNIIGGTGIFEGATGHLDGLVRAAGKANAIKLAGTVIFDPSVALDSGILDSLGVGATHALGHAVPEPAGLTLLGMGLLLGFVRHRKSRETTANE
jgi:hypothetical protein